MNKNLTTNQAAEVLGITRQAIYWAIKNKKLKAQKPLYHQLIITLEDVEAYRKNMYCRDYSRFKGELLYDVSKGEYSLRKAAEYLGLGYNKLYHLTKTGKIQANRKGAAWIFMKSDLDEFRETYCDRIAQ